VLASGPTPSSSAQSGGGQVADAPTLGLTALGGDADVTLHGLQGAQSITVPVPKGLTPSALTADLELPPYVRGGTLVVTQDNRTLSRVELLAADSTPITIPLTGARVVDNTVTFMVRSRLLPEEGDCLYDPTVPLQLNDAAIAYTGTEAAPTRVADFFPPVLQRVTIFIPRKPSVAESAAALQMTTAVVARYGRQNTDVEVAALADNGAAPPSAPLERNVVIRQGGDAAVALRGQPGVPALLITGNADELTNQVRLLNSDLSQLALSAKAVAGPITPSQQPAAGEMAIKDLGQSGVSATAFKPQVIVGVDQTRLGKPVRDVRVHLRGSYTPLPSTVGGQVVVSIGDDTVDRWATESGGTIDRWVDVPNSALQRDTKLSVAVDISGNTGQCGEFQPVTLTIDGSTAIDSKAADPPEPEGFQSVPQTLMPKVEIGIEPNSFDDTARAAVIVEGLQRLSGRQLDAEVATVADAIDSELPAVIVSAAKWDNDKVVPPVRSMAGGKLDVERVGGGGAANLTLDPAVRFASLQVGRSGNRTVVFATSDNAPKELDALLRWLDSDPRRWSSLDGTAVIAQPGHDPVQVNTQAVQPASPAKGTSPLWWIAVGAAAVIGIGLVALVVRRGRRA
jgi:hypothetical protein